MCRRWCGDPDLRGSARNRRARKRWLLQEYGDGTAVYCWRGCGRRLTLATVTVDRIVPGSQGGRYVHDNIMPACSRCQSVEGCAIKHGQAEPVEARVQMASAV